MMLNVCNIKLKIMNRGRWAGLMLLFLLPQLQAYIDIELAMVSSSNDVCLNMPITIDSQQYHIAVSLHNQ